MEIVERNPFAGGKKNTREVLRGFNMPTEGKDIHPDKTIFTSYIHQ
jgi:hypothetical protein